MSAADRMAVRMPDGEIRSVARRVGLAMIAQSRATHERPGQPGKTTKARKSTGRPNVAQSATRAAVTVVTAEAPAPDPEFHLLSQTPRQIAETMRTGEMPGGPAYSPVDDDATALPIEAPAVEQPKGNAGRAAWAQYAGVVGVPVDDEMGRNEIRDAVVAKLESDRMSQPAFSEFEGGRLATPEDEPVTESAVTHADPGERTA